MRVTPGSEPRSPSSSSSSPSTRRRIAGPAQTDLRKIGDVWVAIEVPPAKPLRGLYVSLSTGKMTL